MLYVALLIGIPFGIVRPRLHHPQFWLQFEYSIRYAGLKYSQGSLRPGGGPRWSLLIVNSRTVLVALAAATVSMIVAFYPQSRGSNRCTGITFDPG
jgi:hypothetical protein